MELRLETGDVIYSTDDHPYWSHTKQSMVSRDPSSTLSNYGFAANQLDDEEAFENEDEYRPFGHCDVKQVVVLALLEIVVHN